MHSRVFLSDHRPPPSTHLPWLEDPEDDPALLNWSRALLNPFGTSPRLHFTRAWTALFFVRVIVFFVPMLVVYLLNLIGADDPGFDPIPLWGFPMVVVATGLMSFNLHVRRLVQAKRNALWAFLVVLPLIFGGFGFVSGAAKGARAYTVAVDADALRESGFAPKQIAVDLDRPKVYRTLSRDIMLRLVSQSADAGAPDRVMNTALAASQISESVDRQLEKIGVSLTQNQRERLDTSVNRLSRRLSASFRFDGFLKDTNRASLNDERAAIEARWERHLPKIEFEDVSQRTHGVRTAIGEFISAWALPSFLMMIWSLTFVGRLPNDGGSIKARRLRIEAASV